MYVQHQWNNDANNNVFMLSALLYKLMSYITDFTSIKESSCFKIGRILQFYMVGQKPDCFKKLQLLYDDVEEQSIYQIVWFLPRYAMNKRCLCRYAVSVRPFVCLSVMFVDSVKKNNRVVKFVSPSGIHTILVFPHQTSDGTPPPLTGASSTGGVSRRFWANI